MKSRAVWNPFRRKRTVSDAARIMGQYATAKREVKERNERDRILAVARQMQIDMAAKGIMVPERSRMI